MTITELGREPPGTAAEVAGRRMSRLGLAALAFVLPALGFLLFGSTGRDDSYITYWAADRLRSTGRITNYNGRAVEQSSSLLHVVALAVVSLVTRFSVTTVGPWFAVAAGAACVPIAYALGARLETRGGWFAAALVATLPPLVYWSFGGLETSLATAVVLVTLLVTVSAVEDGRIRAGRIAAVLTAAVLVRPEIGIVLLVGFLLAGCLVWLATPPAWAGRDGRSREIAARRLFALAASVAGIFALVALFRMAYFGAWVPRPVSMKTGGIELAKGFGYAVGAVFPSGTFIALVAFLGFTVARRKELTPAWLITGSVALAGFGSVVAGGGDWMECARLLAPWLAIVVVLAGSSLARLPEHTGRSLAVLLIVANLTGLVVYTQRYSTGATAWSTITWNKKTQQLGRAVPAASLGWWERRNAIHTREIVFANAAGPIVAALSRVVGRHKLVYASGQGGEVVYYLQRAADGRGRPFLFDDVYGLSDNTLDVCRKHAKPTSAGKPVGWPFILAGRCGPIPDVVSGLGGVPHPVIRRYRIVYKQVGPIRTSGWPVVSTRGGEWLAVRLNLVPKLRAELAKHG